MSPGKAGVGTFGDSAGGPVPVVVESLRDRGKRRRRQRILESARDLLRESPERTFTIPELAQRAEVSIPTVSNLIGNRDAIWAALADEALRVVDYDALSHADPQERARAIVAALADVVISDPVVNRALIRDWSHSVWAMSTNPTRELIACFAQAAGAGAGFRVATPRRIGELVATGLVGCLHQWGAGLITDHVMRRRLRDLVDLAFSSVTDAHVARPPAALAPPAGRESAPS